MMFRKTGMTLIEIVVVLVIVSIAACFFFPDFTTPSEQAKAANAQNNLLAIYSAQQNYNNNNNAYCAAACSTLAQINTVLSLQIQDDGTYSYSCAGVAGSCTASRNSNSNLVITAALNQPVKIAGEVNPSCASSTGNGNWCP